MAGTGQTLALDIAPAPNLAQSYLDAGKIQAQQNDNAMAPLDLASKQLDLQQKQALAPLEVQAAKQKLVQQGLEMRATQTKAQQDAADRTMDRVGKAALAVSNASAEDRPGEWKSQLDGLLKTKTIDKNQYDTLVKQQPTDELLDHVIQGHRTYSEMLKTYDAQKTAAKKATLTPDQIANFTKDYAGTLKDTDAGKTEKMKVFSQALSQYGDYAKAVDAAENLGPAGKLALNPDSSKVTDNFTAGFLPGSEPTLNAGAPGRASVFAADAATPDTGFLPPPATAATQAATLPAPAPTAAIAPPVTRSLAPPINRFDTMFKGNAPTQTATPRPAPAPTAAAPVRSYTPPGGKPIKFTDDDALAQAQDALKAGATKAAVVAHLAKLGVPQDKITAAFGQ